MTSSPPNKGHVNDIVWGVSGAVVGLASASRTACRVIALPRKLALYVHTAAASEGSKNTEDVLQKEEGKWVFAGAQKNYVMCQRVR